MSETQDSELFIYPNPAKEKVTIEGIEATEVEVYNALGQRVPSGRGLRWCGGRMKSMLVVCQKGLYGEDYGY